MWIVSFGEYEKFLYTGEFAKLNIEIRCGGKSVETYSAVDNGTTFTTEPFCAPYQRPEEYSKHALTPSELLFDMIDNSHNPKSSKDHNELKQLTNLITSMMMNGLPLLGLSDFIYLSDFANHNINEKEKNKLLSYPGYSDQFSNFLNARTKEIRIIPNSCWASEFAQHLRNTTNTPPGTANVSVASIVTSWA